MYTQRSKCQAAALTVRQISCPNFKNKKKGKLNIPEHNILCNASVNNKSTDSCSLVLTQLMAWAAMQMEQGQAWSLWVWVLMLLLPLTAW